MIGIDIMKKFILCFFILMATSGILRAEPITFEATVNSPRVSLDEALQLTLTFTGINQNLDPISLPTLDGFSAKYLGPSTSISIVNGDYHSERSFIYNLFPNKVGRFQIPPISATIAGQTYTTKPIDVEVFESSTQAQASNGASHVNQGPTTESLKDKIKIMVYLEKREAFLNERVGLDIKLLVNNVSMRDIQLTQFEAPGFIVDPFQASQPYEQVVDGIKYDIIEYKSFIYPSHPGDLVLGPVQIQGNVIYKTGQENPFNQDNSLFGSNGFSNFFDSYATRPVTVTSQPLTLHVASLPQGNRPKDFSGSIGQFDFQANVSPLQVKAGDPLTLKMAITGSGNFKSLKMPVFRAPGFKSYGPQIKDVGGEKTADTVIIPMSASIKEVPILSFSYFDPSIKDYKTITQGPFPIQVTAPNPDQDFKAVGFSDVSRETLGANPFSFGKMLNNVRHILKKLFSSIWFWAGLLLIFAAGISNYLWRRFQDRLVHDPAYARRLKALREATQGLGQAEGYISNAKTKDFYGLLSKVLRDYLANKWHQSSAALSMEEILSHLKTAKLDETHIAQVKTILEEADLVCFAGLDRDAGQMRKDLSQTQDIIAHLEKFLR